MSNEKVMIIYLIVGLIKKISLYKMSYFPEPFSHNEHKIKVDLSCWFVRFVQLCNKTWFKIGVWCQ